MERTKNKKDNSAETLVGEVKRKKAGSGPWLRSLFSSGSVITLKNKIEEYYQIKLVRKKEDDFPWFVDGGFKYTLEDQGWEYEVTAHWQM